LLVMMRIADLVRRQAGARPRELAIRCTDRSLTWSELDGRVDALASVLSTLPHGARVAVLTRSCHRHWEALFACSRAGLIGVPLNYRWLPAEIERVLGDCGAAGLVIDVGGIPAVVAGGDAIEQFAALPEMRLILGFGGLHPRANQYEEALAAAPSGVQREPCPINVLGYTSGTTGRPKGAALTPDAAVLSAFWFASLFELGTDDRFLACMPIYVYRGGAGGLAPFVVGAATVLRDFEPGAVLDAIEQERITHCILAPIMVDRLLRQPELRQRDLSSLRGIWVGGAPSSPSAIAALQDLVGDIVGSTYGCTEATGIASMRWPHAAADHPRMRSVGRPSPLMDVKLLSADGEDAAARSPGEIVVRGDAVMAGYWPDVPGGGLTDGWYHTGDIAVRDDDGYLFLVDRHVDIVNSGGLNVYSTEVELALLEHPDIVECAVVGAPDDTLGESVTAYVVTARALPLDEIDAHCRARLAGYKRPRTILVLDALPRNAMGKVEKQTLRQPLWEGRNSTIAAPSSPAPS
jgi:acyl-CoA synthetase (AMP-forming)/AMP-acid ligase II